MKYKKKEKKEKYRYKVREIEYFLPFYYQNRYNNKERDT